MGLVRSLAEKGFAEVKLPRDLHDGALALAESFYRLPLQSRMEIGAFTTRGVLGYYPSESEASEYAAAGHLEIPLFAGGRARGYSSFDFIANSNVVGSSPLLGRNLWPAADPDFSYAAGSVYSDFVKLSRQLAMDVLADLGPSCKMPAATFERDSCSLMRLLRYRKGATIAYSKPHTDYEFLTLTVANAAGLQIRRGRSEWQQLPSSKGAAIILPGDMLELIAPEIPSSLHRVEFGEVDRTSVVFFQGLPLTHQLSREVAGYSPRTFGDHLLAMLVRGAAHLKNDIGEWETVLGFTIPDQNPFRRHKE